MSVICGNVAVYMKHNDMTSFEVLSKENVTLYEKYSDYFPKVACFGGDDTSMLIDNETGRIIGWQPITSEQLDELKEEK